VGADGSGARWAGSRLDEGRSRQDEGAAGARVSIEGVMRSLSHPRRYQLRHAALSFLQAVIAAGLVIASLTALASGQAPLAVAASAAGLAVGASAWRHGRRSRRNRIGADSEERVARVLAGLRARGWIVQSEISWAGPGDIDNALVSPAGCAVAVETKTSRYDAADLSLTRAKAIWLASAHRGCHDAIAVIALAGRRGVNRLEDGVRIVSRDRLLAALGEIERSHRPSPDERRQGLS
jgi:hypothetical protein